MSVTTRCPHCDGIISARWRDDLGDAVTVHLASCPALPPKLDPKENRP